MATLEQLAEGIRRADAAGDAEAVRSLGQAYRAMQAQPQGGAGYANPVVKDGQTIGGYTQQPGAPLRVMVDASPEQPSNPIGTALSQMGQGAYSSLTGALQGATMGAYDEISSVLGTPIVAAQRMMTGQDSINGMGDILPMLGRSYGATREGQKNLTQQAYERAPAAFIAGDLAGSVGLGGATAAAGGGLMANMVKPTILGGAWRGAAEGGMSGFGSGFNTSESDALPERVKSGVVSGAVGAGLGALTGGVVGGIAGKQQRAQVASSQQLKEAASSIYDGLRNSGAAVPPADYDGLANRIASVASSQNVVLPNGATNPTYSALAGPLQVLDAYRGQPVGIGQLLAIRTNIRDAAANVEPGVSRIGMDMLDQFNDYLYKIAPEIQQADDLYWRGKTGELIEKLGELATARSGQYSQSGMENALRAEFRLLERQIIKGRVNGLPPELVDQIKLVSQGGDIQNFARWISKFGIQNPITSLTGMGAGLATGSVLPAVGIWGAAQGAGATARALALESYNGASALARSGGKLPAYAIPSIQAGLPQAAGQQGKRAPSILDRAIYGTIKR